MNRILRTSVIVVVIAYLGFHVATLNISPLPWFDEVVFADVAVNYADKGKMEMSVVPLYYQGQVYQYGPVYFALQALVMKTIGLGPASFRLLNFICGLGLVIMLCKIFRRNNDQPATAWLLAALILFDTIFNQNLHSGRMDLVAMFFVTCSILCVDYFKRDRRYYQLALIGVFAAVAFLTTPRSLFLLTAPGVFFMLRSNRQDSDPVFDHRVLTNGAIAGLCFIVPVLATIQLTVGFSDYYHGMTSANNGESMSSFISGSLLRESYENHVIVIMLIVALIFYKKVLQSPILLSLLAGFCTFSLFVKEAGPYSAMIMPFVYFVIVALVANANLKVRYATILILLAVNTGIFVVKGITVVASAKERNVNSDDYAALESIPPGSRILSDYRMFYWAHAHNNTFESYSHYRTSDEVYVKHIVDEYRPDFVMIKPGDEKKAIFTDPSFVTNYKLLEEVRVTNRTTNKLTQYIRRLIPFDANFESIVYIRTDHAR